MSLEQLQLAFDYKNDRLSFVFQEQKEADEESIQMNGRAFGILGKPTHITLLKQIIPGFSSKKDMSAIELRQMLSQIDEVSALTVASSLSISDRIEQMEGFIRAMVEQEGFGGAVLVKSGGKRVVYGGFGVADESGTLNTVKTRFCIGSITKQFTSTAILLLIQEGKFSLDCEINSLLPERYQSLKWKGITVRHLLSMSSGIHDIGSDAEDVGRSMVFRLDEIVAQFSDADLRFYPGEMHEYCNSSYTLLGAIIEECSKQSYNDCLKTRIFDRYVMKNTGLFSSFGAEAQASGFYLGVDGKRKCIDPSEMAIHCSKAFSAGGLVSSIEDMEKWNEALYDDDLLTPESRRAMADTGEGSILFDPARWAYESDDQGRAKPKVGVTYDRVRYGFGVFVDGNGEIVFHGGMIPGFTSFIVRNTVTRDCVVVLCNQIFISSPDDMPMPEMMALHLWEMLQR